MAIGRGFPGARCRPRMFLGGHGYNKSSCRSRSFIGSVADALDAENVPPISDAALGVMCVATFFSVPVVAFLLMLWGGN